MSHVGISTPKEFLINVVKPDMDDLKSSSCTELRAAYHACISLLSLRDWVGLHHDGKPWQYKSVHQGVIDKSRLKAGFGADLISIDDSFAKVFDIANASKHMVLDSKQKLTDLYGSANVHIQPIGSSILGEAILDEMILGSAGTPTIFVQIGKDFFEVLPLADKVYEIWKELFDENGW